MATHSSIPAWEILWTEAPGRLQSVGSQRVGHDLVTKPPPQLTYNVVLISGIQQSDSLRYIHIFFFRFFSIVDYYRILNIVPCAICPYYLSIAYSSVYMLIPNP